MMMWNTELVMLECWLMDVYFFKIYLTIPFSSIVHISEGDTWLT